MCADGSAGYDCRVCKKTTGNKVSSYPACPVRMKRTFLVGIKVVDIGRAEDSGGI